MIDIFALALSHGLILLGLWRLLGRADFDGDLPESDVIPAKAGTQTAQSPGQKLGSRFRGNDKDGENTRHA